MKLIVGLGNPGNKYELTRHNVGFMVLDHFLKDMEPVSSSNWNQDKKLKSQIFVFDYQPKQRERQKVILAKPLTYMNNSGMAVLLIAKFYKIKPQDIWIVHDELDLPLGFMKIRFGGGTAGHHGVNSILESISTDKFWRFRLGIGYSKNKDSIARHKFKNTKDFVLDRFTTHETRSLKHLLKRAVGALTVAIEKDINTARSRFNTK
ncbi:MAG: aminoacyl-tRNA hydrolase [Candidatus Levybacteria bacterium]|nr:aminoacyl-tRNA hydrolase [Candidatus Levybacteria bacterium]